MSINEENNNRITILFKKHYKSLINYANNITKDIEVSEDLVSSLILFLLEKPNSKLWYADSFNLAYLQKFIYSKFINHINFANKNLCFDDLKIDSIEDEYDMNNDLLTEELLQEYIRIINSKKDVNKYGTLYVKHKLYNMSVKSCARIMDLHINSLYSNFRTFDEEVNEEFEKNKLIIVEKYKNNI